LNMKPHRFKVKKEKAMFVNPSTVPLSPPVEWEYVEEMLSDKNYTRFSTLHEDIKDVWYHQWWHKARGQCTFDDWLTMNEYRIFGKISTTR